ncbi:regulator [Leptolyngbya sp. 'hensonii']|uniref:PP2C family protein-serine/threonine phosphatase n=1 Tax=Leptolyngbya sp. 'hensonii' TaxID=1922337 RepID=UPI0009501691|nr:SpoIIE family protein phosphatase [Leptolyngbya sp. 'hensonii']OLP18464.1 regulator [Leptolyngbya sp. 'hensonii']
MFKVLIIDDDSATRALLKRTLQNQGYEVFTANHGEEGIALATQLRPALIVCDLVMPGIDGLEVCQLIKSDPELSTSFFLLLTFRGAKEGLIQGLDKGADDILAKPIEMSELKARVRAGLRLYQLTQDLQAKNRMLQGLTQDLQLQKQVLEAEFTEASEYVRSLLPSSLTGSVTIDPRFIPSRQLGGDCFDYDWLDPDYLAIYLLDVSGHGLGAALPSVSVLNMLRSQSLPDANLYQPNHVLMALNEAFQMTDQNERYFTIWYGVYNRLQQQLVYSSAGHAPGILINRSVDGTVTAKQLRTPGMPIGMFPDSKFSNAYCRIEPGSKLYIFSDGIFDLLQPDGNLWGLHDLINLLVSCAERGNTNLDSILEQIQNLAPKKAFDDDACLLEITFSADPALED